MLVGSSGIQQLTERAPVMESLHTELLALADVEILQVTYEIGVGAREAVLPPALHPTNPPLATWLFWRCAASPWGAFTLAQTRIECRSGVRPRAFLLGGFIDNAAAAKALTAGWGYRARIGEVSLRRQYDAIAGTVRVGGECVLTAMAMNPDPLSADDVQYVANMNLAETPRGLRLVQVDPEHHVKRAERGHPHIESFNAPEWGDSRVRPTYPVSASFVIADVTLPRLRYVCRPDVWAFDGTESVSRKQ